MQSGRPGQIKRVDAQTRLVWMGLYTLQSKMLSAFQLFYYFLLHTHCYCDNALASTVPWNIPSQQYPFHQNQCQLTSSSTTTISRLLNDSNEPRISMSLTCCCNLTHSGTADDVGTTARAALDCRQHQNLRQYSFHWTHNHVSLVLHLNKMSGTATHAIILSRML